MLQSLQVPLLQHNFFSVASKTTKQTKLLKMAAVKAEAKYAAVPEDEEGAQATAAVAVAIKKETDDEAPSLSSDAHDVKENKSQLEVEGQPWKQGERQQPAFRDKWFVVVFLLHLMAIIATAITLGSNVFSNSALDDSSFNGNSEEPKDDADAPAGMFGAIIVISTLLSPTLSIVALGIMSKNAVKLLEFSLIFGMVYLQQSWPSMLVRHGIAFLTLLLTSRQLLQPYNSILESCLWPSHQW